MPPYGTDITRKERGETMKNYLAVLAAATIIAFPGIASAQYVVAGPVAAPAPAPARAPAPQPWHCDGVCPTSYFQISLDLQGSTERGGAVFKIGYGWGTNIMSNMVSFVFGGSSLNDYNSDQPDDDWFIGASYDIYKPLHWSQWFRIGFVGGLAGGLGGYTAYTSDGIEENSTGLHVEGKVGLFMSWLPGPIARYNWYSGDFEYIPNYLELFAKGSMDMSGQIGVMENSSYSNFYVGLNIGWWLIFW